MKSEAWLLLALCWTALCLAACSGGKTDRPFHVVLITIDTIRADRLGCYGYFRETSPAIDALAAESLLFERCVAPMATTLPSHVTLLTGLNPLEHGVMCNFGQGGDPFRPSEAMRSLAMMLKDQGYQTAGFVSATPVKASTGVATGFDVFDEPENAERRAAETNARVLEFLDGRSSEQPLFLWVHYFDPHSPYAPPPPYDVQFSSDEELEQYLAEREFQEGERLFPPMQKRLPVDHANNLYDGEVRYTDEQVGILLDRLRGDTAFWDETMLVLVGDHGEGLRQHSMGSHGSIWDEQVHVPFIMRVPGVEAGRVTQATAMADVLPTLAVLGDLPCAEEIAAQASGIDVLDPSIPARGIFSQDSGLENVARGPMKYTFTRDSWKLIQRPEKRRWLFDLTTDPYELRDLSAARGGLADTLSAELEVALSRQRARGEAIKAGKPVVKTKADEKMKRELKALGY